MTVDPPVTKRIVSKVKIKWNKHMAINNAITATQIPVGNNTTRGTTFLAHQVTTPSKSEHHNTRVPYAQTRHSPAILLETMQPFETKG
jgi:hypothetical protein